MTTIVQYFRRFLRNARGRLAGVPIKNNSNGEPQNESSFNLSSARLALASGAFDEAYLAYAAAQAQNNDNLECHIGIALCHFHRGLTSQAMAVLENVQSQFGNHDAILGILVKCHLRLLSWETIESTWREWLAAAGEYPTGDFYQTSGEILVSLIKFGIESVFRDEILACLLYQPDATVDRQSHPVICSVLFHHHEYDRPVYKQLMAALLSYRQAYGIEVDRNMSIATVVLSFGLVETEERHSLIDRFFSDFDLYAHWTFVLLASAWTAAWDTSLANKKNLSIASEILTSRLDNIVEWPPELLYSAFILADICCRDAVPRLLLNTRARLQTDDNLGDYREDFSYICRYRSSQLAAPALAKALDRSLRIAVCISGQLRGYKQAFPTWHFLGLGDHHVCYVVHTWKDVGGGLPIPPKDARVLSGSFLEAYRAAWNELGQEAMFSRYPGLFGLWAKDGGVADKGELIAFYGTEFVTVEDDAEEKFHAFTNAKKMYYKIERCHETAKSLGIEFDLMIRIRPDWAFQKKCEIDWYELFRCSRAEKTLFCEHYSPYLFPHIGYCMGDQFAIATPNAMDGYAAAYGLTQDAIMGTRLRHFPANFMAHRNVAFATLYSGVTVNSQGISCPLAPAYRPSSESILTAIQAATHDDEMHRRLLRAAVFDAGITV